MKSPDYARREVGHRIRRERTLWNLTQEEFSQLLGISTNYLGQIERGTRDLSRKMEDRICEVFHLSHEQFHRDVFGHPYSYVASESGGIFYDLTEDDLFRLLRSCNHEELQLCGHLLRSMLHYTRSARSRKPEAAGCSAEEPARMPEVRLLSTEPPEDP